MFAFTSVAWSQIQGSRMSKLTLIAACALCLSSPDLYSEPLERTFGPDQQRGYRPERTTPTQLPGRPITEFSSQQRQGIWARWYYQKVHNLLPDE